MPRSCAVTDPADPFLAAALFPAMMLGRKIEVDPGLSVPPGLLENLRALQEIPHVWDPRLRIVPIEARTAPGRALRDGVLSFFEGGVPGRPGRRGFAGLLRAHPARASLVRKGVKAPVRFDSGRPVGVSFRP